MNIKINLAAILAATVLFSCSKNESPATPEDPGNFIVTVSPAAATGVAD